MELTLTDGNFQQTVAAGGVVLVDFWAAWCSPCRMLSPIIGEIAAEYAGRVVVGKCNIDDCGQTVAQLGIMSIPTVMIFRDGQLAGTAVGYHDKEYYTNQLDKLLG